MVSQADWPEQAAQPARPEQLAGSERLAGSKQPELPDVRWLWNGAMEPGVIRRQLVALRDHGLHRVAIWPWAGLELPYLSEEYLSRLVLACELAEELNVTLWLADDLNWPSGTMGGRLLEARPELGQRALVCTSRWVPHSAPHTVRWRGEGEQLVLALALDPGGGRRDLARSLELGGRPVREGRVARFGGHEVAWEADVWDAELRIPSGDWFLSVATVVRCRPLLASSLGTRWSAALTGALDALNPAAVRAFGEATLERYGAALRHWFGGTVRGLVTAPPGALLPHPIAPPEGWRVDVVPWFPVLPDVVQRRGGRSLQDVLPYALASLHQAPAAVGGAAQGAPDAVFAPLQSAAAERYAAAYLPVLSELCRGVGLQLAPVEPAALPAVPYTLLGDRKRALRPAEVLAVQVPPGATPPDEPHRSAAPPPGPGRVWRLESFPSQRPGWRVLDVLAATWDWRPRSLNLHALEPLAETAAPGDRLILGGGFEAEYAPADLALVFEHSVVEAVSINGVEVDLSAAKPVMTEEVEFADGAARLVALAGAGVDVRSAGRGANLVAARVHRPAAERIAFFDEAQLGPLFLAGNFALASAGGGGMPYRLARPPAALPAGDWGAAGYPRFCGTAVYRQSVFLPDLPSGGSVQLVVDAHGGRVALAVNSCPAGGPVAAPCVFELTGALRPGANQLALSVTNTLASRLAGGVPSGLAAARLEYRAA